MSAQQNNAMGTVYVPSPINNPAILPHPAAASHEVAHVWNHPPEGYSQLAIVRPNIVMNQPHNGYAVPNIGMHFPNNVTGWGSNPSHNIPTSQAPSTAGVPAYNYDFVANQHGTFQRGQVQHEQAQRGQAQHGQAQQRYVKRRKVQRGTGQHASGSNTHGPNQPSAGTPSVNTPAAPSYPAHAPVHHAIDAITAEFLRTADPRGAQFGPGDIVDQIWLDWFLGQPQQGQAMGQVRNTPPNIQGIEAGNLTLMNHSIQVKPATRPEVLAITSQMVRCLPTPHSPKTRSAITLPFSGPGLLKPRSHRTRRIS